ncbi:hypothetical protein LTR56_006007 [Elasticomyces elasticus]|nr:hypothetical protein LTR56_006007 [Elasticomyces elasticus]KAK3669032.1 hypothetical protein LTR22_000111 [Elasticomyces elasticus]KAK5760924.1 hypothetical protein LTS12_008928 [Elasticomyces elasticus]
MADIYRNGTGNLICLDEGIDDPAAIVAALNFVHAANGCATSDWGGADTSKSHGAMADLHYKHSNDLYSAGCFSRSWVVQEVVLSKQSTMVLGNSLLPLKKVLCVARSCYYYDRRLDDANLFIVRMLASILDKGDKVAHPKSADTVSSPAAAMYHLLFAMMYQELSDPRDRIYSILGLINWPEGIPSLLVPDYGKSARDVHRDAARYQLRDPGLRLATLQQVYHYSAPAISEVDMPSWVPCWIRSRMDLRPSGSHLFDHAAHSDTAVDVRSMETKGPDVLEVSGVSVDFVAQVGEIFERTDFAEQSSVGEVLNLFHKVRRLLPADLATNAGMFELANVLLQGWPNVKAWNLEDWAHWTKEETVENISAYITYLVEHKHQPPMLESLAIGEDAAVRKASRFLKQLVWVWADNQLFQTASGRIGIGRGIMNPADALVVLYGGQVPFVLRPSGVYHQYICDAYCHGIMNGEAISQHQAEGRASQVFRLR